MKPMPPLIVSLSLLFWSWQVGAWLPGLILIAWFEWATRTPWRWSLAEKTIERIVDLTSLTLVALVIFAYQRGSLSGGLFAVLHWSPLLLAPLLSAQILSARVGLSRRALFLSQRRRRSPDAERLIDLRPVYLAACLLGAGVGSAVTMPHAYFGGLLALFMWALAWQLRARPRPLWPLALVALVALGLAGAIAMVGQQVLTGAQGRVEDIAVGWMSGMFAHDKNPYRARTALGDIGTLKLSDRVLYRVSTAAPLPTALLLRTAAYDRYANTTWFAHEQDFTPVPRHADGWQWAAAPDSSRSVQIGSYLQRRGHLLPLPTGTYRLTDLPVAQLQRLPLGAVKANDGPPLILYRADYAPAALSDRPPDEADLRVPNPEQPVLQALIEALGLAELETTEKVRRISDYFAADFRYSLQLPGATPDQTAIAHFLTTSRQGHCEFFASATTLLLRQAGVPARYAVGYSVQEPDGTPNRYLVRRSHAHAWTLFWHQGQWWDLDTTPALWAELEAAQRPFWQPLADLWSRLWYAFNLSRLTPDQDTPVWLWFLLAGLFALLAYRLRLGERWRARQARQQRQRSAAADSPLVPIASALTRAGWPRQPGETDRQWLRRIGQTAAPEHALPNTDELLRLHERARYRPGGLDPEENTRLLREITHWLTLWSRSTRRHPH